MTAKITTLITTQETSEIIRDKIAAILAEEIANQQVLAAGEPDPTLWKLRIYLERANPWEAFQDATDATIDTSPLVNVSLDRVDYKMSSGGVVDNQAATAIYHLDCYALGVSAEQGAGHIAGDEAAALAAQRAKRLTRQIVMAGVYTYLGLRKTVWRRWLQTEESFTPAFDNRALQQIGAVRLSLAVDFAEMSPQVQAVTLEQINATIKRAEDGQVVATATYDFTA